MSIGLCRNARADRSLFQGFVESLATDLGLLGRPNRVGGLLKSGDPLCHQPHGIASKTGSYF